VSEDNLMCGCGWIGTRQELVSKESDDNSFIYCPDCQDADDLESEEE
jgi:hypothetical protein